MMEKKKHLFILFALMLTLLSPALSAADRKDRKQRDTTQYSDTYLDTVKVNSVFVLNDYFMVGVEAGFGFNRMMFNPSYTQSWRRFPEHLEVTFTKYGKMFGYMPYFGLKAGVAYSHEGFLMKMNEETGYIGSISGATECDYEIVEIPFLANFHYDLPSFKILMDLGPYAAYKLSINRIGEGVTDDIRNTFLDTDKRFDYGIRAGAGFALVFDPVELHFTAKVRYSFQNLFDPDYLSQYYYRYAYPLDLMLTAGLHFQLTKKTGKTKAALRKEAYNIVFGEEPKL